MQISSGSIKSAARGSLISNFGSLFVCTIILCAVCILNALLALLVSYFNFPIFSIFSLAFGIVFLLLPLVLGFFRYCWRLLASVTDNPISIFYYFSSLARFKKSMSLIFSMTWRMFLSWLVFSIPVYVLRLITGAWLYATLNTAVPIWTVNLVNVVYFLRFLAVIATFLSSIKYYLAPMLIIADENMEVAEAIHLSSVISKRSTLDFVFLILSFIGWAILSIFALPLFFTIPYFVISYLIHCSHSVGYFNLEIDKINQTEVPTYIAGV